MKYISSLVAAVFFVGFIQAQGNTCGTATTITPTASCSYTSGTTVGQSYENNPNNGGTPTCASPGAPDVWYVFTATVSGNYTIDTQTGTITDGGMAIYSGACGSLTQIACDDDSSPNGMMPMITASLTAGQTYYVRVWAYGGSNVGTFGICVTTPPAPPANDNCATATTVTQQPNGSCTTVSSTVAGATSSGIANCTGTADDDVWFRFTATNTTAIINRTTTGSWDSGIEIFASTGAAPGNCIGASLGCQDSESSFTVNGLAVGMNYYVRVYSWSAGFTPGTPGFTLCVTSPPTLPAGSIVMSNGSASACSGSFYDPGGALDYGDGISGMVFTICPSTAGSKLKAVFTSFQTENGADFLEIFDGNSTAAPSLGTYTGTTSPGTVQATPGNASGCLTFRFTSDGSVTYPGWIATLSCVLPCQTITSNWISSNEAPMGDGIIRICQNQSVNFVGSGTFSSSGTGATYTWQFGDGTTANGTSVNHTYTTPGSYFVNLLITDPNGCTNTNAFNRNVQVSTTPTITTSANPTTVCAGQPSNLTANVTMTPYTQVCTPPISGTTFLPDGSGVSYQTAINVNCYSSTAAITSAADFTNVCMSMEHSYLGDLQIELICPNGQTMILKSYADGGSGTYLGSPIDDVTSGPGTGSTYCFTPSASTLMVNGGTVTAGSPSGNSIIAGNYMPTQPFTNLIGCPLNGAWTIRVTDNLSADDGYIFNWDVNFNNALVSAPSFTPTIVSQGWQAATGLTSTGATTATVIPTATGTPCYTYSVTDNFGCTYTNPQCITVNCSVLPVGLLEFNAIAINNDYVHTSWSTTGEFNNDYFVIQQSVNGVDWVAIGEVQGQGSFDGVTHYEWNDFMPAYGVSYYRLVQYDFNASETIYMPKTVIIEVGDDEAMVAYPNPTTNYVTLKGKMVELSDVSVTNLLGESMTNACNLRVEYDGSILLDMTSLSSGVYLIRCGENSLSITKK
jgi:subtilisin-like proprotein convertase family protein